MRSRAENAHIAQFSPAGEGNVRSLAYACALLTYEVGLFFGPPLVAAAWWGRGALPARRRALACICAVTGAYLLANFVRPN